MERQRDPQRTGLLVLVLLAIAASLALLRWDFGNTHADVATAARGSPDAGLDTDAGVSRASADAGPARAAPPTACLPRAVKACHQGDVWWFDSCGAAQTVAQRCDGRSCTGSSCAPDETSEHACGQISAYGICEGPEAKACIGNHLVTVDCSRKGERCVMTREGAGCLPRDDKLGCNGSELATCVGDRLRQCLDGLWAEIDCSVRKASCTTVQGGAQCTSSQPLAAPKPAIEICDGRDNDLDGRTDEAGACDTVPLVAFVPAGAKLANLETRMRDELAILNRIFTPLLFEWAKTVEVAASYRSFDPKRIEDAAWQLSQSESKGFATRAPAASGVNAGLAFYVAVLFTEKLRMDPPKAGISTLPNARCGGVRVSDAPSPPHGLIVLSEARSPETLTHELGHYLGLCHTHEELARFAVANPAQLECQRSGDGICDTPPDEGPSACTPRDLCQFFCPRSLARPDASNVMSYYLGCRRALSAEQIAEAERNLSLRRGWFRCLDPRACPCEPATAHACPEEMSCHPGSSIEAAWTCELDGPAMPGTPCRDASQCALGAICLSADGATARCTRPCRNNDTCTCSNVGLPFRVCAEDLR